MFVGGKASREERFMRYGLELIEDLERENEHLRATLEHRQERINEGLTDMDDCFLSDRLETRAIHTNDRKISLIKDGGCAWFGEYSTLDGTLVNAHWCNTRYGLKLRAEMPDGSVIWTSADTPKGLAKVGLKKVLCKRPAWFCFSGGKGLYGAYSGDYVLFPSSVNYATGEDAGVDPIEIKDK